MLKHWSYSSTALLIVITASGCSDKTNDPHGPSDDILPQVDVPDGDVRWLPLQDPNCINRIAAWASPLRANIYEWNGIETRPKIVPFSWANNKDIPFATDQVLGSAINFESNKKCTLSSSGVKKCENTDNKAIKFSLMNMCRSDANYARHSLEGMSLTSLHYTETAYAFYNSIKNSLSGIPKSILLIQPKFSSEITKADGQTMTKVDTDNASFTEIEKDGDDPAKGLFIVYPTSKKAFLKSGLNLWEVPFVMRHEFGHHVFSHYVKDSATAIGLTIARHTNISSIMKSSERTHHSRLSLTSNNDIPQFALDGINEVYADLFGYFAGNSAKNQLKGVECLDISRDPASAVTKAGESKGITKARIDIYEGRAAAPSNNADCYEPSYDDEHDMATALGNPLAKFIETATPNAEGKERAALLLTWASRIQKVVLLGKSNINTDTLVRELILGAKTSADVSMACRELKPLITGLPLSTQACGG